LNSAVGGANPDAVEIAARLGGRVVWMPTVSARTHKAGAASPELAVHRGFELRLVEVLDDAGALRPEWFDVLDAVARHDLLLCSGHLSAAETVVLFTQARRRGVARLLVNHPMMAFLGWNEASATALPLMPEKIRLVTTLTCARPPGRWPTMAPPKAKRRPITPLAFITLATKMNIGTAIRR